MADPLNVALLGQKFMARAHSNAYLKVARFFNLPRQPVMHSISGRDLIALAPFADRWGWQHYDTNWKQVIKNPEIDLVDISTPTYLHCEQALAAIAAGKHVACEKPLAISLKEARQMRNAAIRSKRSRTFVWYNYRRAPAAALAYRLVSDGFLGKIYHIRAQYLQSWATPEEELTWRFQKRYSGAGAIGDQGAQAIDLVRFITGDEIVEVTGAFSEIFINDRALQPTAATKAAPPRRAPRGKVDVDDATVFTARTSKGAIGIFEASRVAVGHDNQIALEISGEHGALRYYSDDMNAIHLYDLRQEKRTNGWRRVVSTLSGEHPYAGAWWPEGHLLGFEHTYVNTLADIAASIGGEQPIVPLADFADAYETQRVVEAVMMSAKGRCAVKLTEVK